MGGEERHFAIFFLLPLGLWDCPVVTASSRFRHGWNTSAEMTFADMSAPKLLSDAELSFVSEHYRVFSMEKCSGSQSPNVTTEEYIYTTAIKLKNMNPSTKTFFYWATDQQGIWCYNASSDFNAREEWHLKDDFGNFVSNGHGHVLDFTNNDAAEWWVNVPLKGNGDGTWNGRKIGEIIDGVLADGAHRPNYPNISASRLNALGDAKFLAIGDLQRRLTKLNNGLVMANGISMYPPPNTDPRFNDHNVHVLNVAGAVMNEHTCAFESVHSNNATYNFERVREDLDAIDFAATMYNGSKSVFVQTWPGMYAGVETYPPVANGGEPTPVTNDEWRDALRRHFPFAHALALTVARENVFWFYGGTWYSQSTGFIPCPNDPTSCRAPSEWYPDLTRPLGSPLGPRKEISPNVWTREFEHATSRLDLVHPNTSGVTFY